MSDTAKVGEATELILTTALNALEGADDDDTVRPRMILEELSQLGAEKFDLALKVPDGITVAEMRSNVRRGLALLARGGP